MRAGKSEVAKWLSGGATEWSNVGGGKLLGGGSLCPSDDNSDDGGVGGSDGGRRVCELGGGRN